MMNNSYFCLSWAAVSGQPSPKAFCLIGSIQGKPMNILLDSGSSHTFISESLAAQLSGVADIPVPVSVKVANGQLLQCVSFLPAASWMVNNVEFQNDLRILSLSSYDMILGLDWLEQFSPMRVHWKHRWLSIPYNGSTVILTGNLDSLPQGSVIQVCSIQVEVQESVSAIIPPEVQDILDEFAAVFRVLTELPPSRSCDHSIPLVPGASPVNVRPYRFAPALKTEIEKQVQEMLTNGIIQKSVSPFSSSVLLVKKKDNSWCFCVDYRHRNAITLKSKYPVPIIDEFLDELGSTSWFSCLDLSSGFPQIRLKPGEEFKTAFQTHFGHFEFRVLAFRLTGAPGTFQSAMNTTLSPYLRKFVLVFFDDILIYSRTFEEHLLHLRLVFELLARDQWLVKRSKCSFAQCEIRYSGHVLSERGVSTDPSKISDVAQWPRPAYTKELRSFLGLAGYYRKFVRHFGVISKPLTDLLKKHSMFVWTDAHDQSFKALKEALCNAPVLALPDFSKPFALETDASGTGVGAVLLQNGHPLAYIRKALGPRSQGLSTYEKEYLAILLAVQHRRSYLQHQEFVIFTDQRSLSQLNEQRLHTPWQQKVFTKLLGLQYRVVYKRGVDNRVADALSRKSSHESQCSALSSCEPQWLSKVMFGYQSDEFSSQLVSKLAIDPHAITDFTLHQGLLRYKKRIWVGNNPQLQSKLLHAFHSSPIGGHLGFQSRTVV